jgi:hypothetical protein
MAARVSAIEAVGAAEPSAKPTLPSRLSALLRSLVPCSSGAPGAAAAAAAGIHPSPSPAPPPCVGGTSRAGLASKKPNGRRVRLTRSTGMTGQSSGRGM